MGERSHLPPDVIDLSPQIADVTGEIKWKDLDGIGVLVGHSYGGMVITGVADQLRSRVSAIVYLDAFMPENNQSLYEINHASPPSVAAVKPPPASYFDVNPSDLAWVDLCKIDAASDQMLYRGTEGDAGIPEHFQEVYVRSSLYSRVLPLTILLERCRADNSWKTETVTCGHDVMIDQPDVLTAILEKLV